MRSTKLSTFKIFLGKPLEALQVLPVLIIPCTVEKLV